VREASIYSQAAQSAILLLLKGCAILSLEDNLLQKTGLICGSSTAESGFTVHFIDQIQPINIYKERLKI
jgi:hypothetical protein